MSQNLFRLVALILALGWLPAARAQIEPPRMLDPSDPQPTLSDDAPAGDAGSEALYDEGYGWDEEPGAAASPPPSPERPARREATRSVREPQAPAPPPRPAPRRTSATRSTPETKAVARPGKSSPKVPRIISVSAGDAELFEGWRTWTVANSARDARATEAAHARLLELKADLGISDLDLFSAGFVRASAKRLEASDPVGAVEAAQSAVALAPSLPLAHFALAHARLKANLTDVGGVSSAFLAGLKATAADPRYRLPLLADVGAALLLGLTLTALVVVLALFVRRSRSFFHDVHHLFPRSASRWHSAILATFALLLPLVLNLGLVSWLLVLLVASTLYLSTSERVVAGLLVASLGAVPLLAGLVVEHTSFAGTAAEDVYQVERGGLGAAPAVERIARRVETGLAKPEETFSLGRYHLRRGRHDEAIALFQKVANDQEQNPALLTNLGNAMAGRGDTEGALEAYRTATGMDPQLAVAHFNASRIHYRRAAVSDDSQVGDFLRQAQASLSTARRLDPRLASIEEPPADRYTLTRLLLSPGLDHAALLGLARNREAGSQVEAQIRRSLLGDLPAPMAWGFPVTGAVFVLVLGLLPLGRSAGCERCGRSACRRCDPELGRGAVLCGQCLHVFARRDAVTPQVRVRKQAEVAHHSTRREQLSYLFGALFSGGGHLLWGAPVRGALYAFVFLSLVCGLALMAGWVRAPFTELPLAVKLVPLAIASAAVYFMTLRGLRRTHQEG